MKVTVRVLLILAPMLTAACWLTERIGEPTADLHCINSDVKHFDAEASEVSPVARGQHRRMHRGDGTTVDHSGYAHLDMGGCLLEIFRDSGVNIEGLPLESAQACIVDFEHGTIYNRVERKMIISTDWAVITNMGTEFLVHLDLDRGLLWVVVTDGVVRVEAAGEVVYVGAAEQTWVERGRPPEPPRPATRTEVGNLFPPVDELTNDEMDDPSVLVSEPVGVPDVLEMDLEQALAHIEAAGLQVGQVYEEESDKEPGIVLDQQPDPGSGVEPGSEVYLLVAIAIERMTPVPDVLGLYVDLAREEIEKAGLEVGATINETSETFEAGTVIRSEPKAGAQLNPGEQVTLHVASGPGEVVVPYVGELSVDQAKATITESGLKVGAASGEEYHDTIAKGLVIRTKPQSGELVERGTEVTVVVSRGHEPVTVPSVAQGSTVALAEDMLNKAGLQASAIRAEEHHETIPAGQILRTDPAGGSTVEYGSEVTLVVSLGHGPVQVPTGLAGLTVEQALDRLEKTGLKGVEGEPEFHETVPEDHVIETWPAGGEAVQYGSEVTLVVSRGKCLPPEIPYFRANPDHINEGECATLEWGAVTNVTEASIDHGIGGVSTPGSRQRCPGETTTYLFNAIGRCGTATASATVTVKPSVQMDSFLGSWVNADPSGGMTRLVIDKVDDHTVAFHGYGKCHPTDCVWDTSPHVVTRPSAVPFTPPKLIGSYTFTFKTTRITVERSGDYLLVEAFHDYTEADGRTDRTDYHSMQRDWEIKRISGTGGLVGVDSGLSREGKAP